MAGLDSDSTGSLRRAFSNLRSFRAGPGNSSSITRSFLLSPSITPPLAAGPWALCEVSVRLHPGPPRAGGRLLCTPSPAKEDTELLLAQGRFPFPTQAPEEASPYPGPGKAGWRDRAGHGPSHNVKHDRQPSGVFLQVIEVRDPFHNPALHRQPEKAKLRDTTFTFDSSSPQSSVMKSRAKGLLSPWQPKESKLKVGCLFFQSFKPLCQRKRQMQLPFTKERCISTGW